MLLFLDFDGVLHPEPCRDTTQLLCNLPLLESTLMGLKDLDIVISSTWRHQHSLPALRALFCPDIGNRMIDTTPRWQDLPALCEVIGPTYVRQVKIEGWLRQANRVWEPWVALDDKPYWFRPFLPNLVCCDPQVGLNQTSANALRSKLVAAVS